MNKFSLSDDPAVQGAFERSVSDLLEATLHPGVSLCPTS